MERGGFVVVAVVDSVSQEERLRSSEWCWVAPVDRPHAEARGSQV